jgi:hypothetical protein
MRTIEPKMFVKIIIQTAVKIGFMLLILRGLFACQHTPIEERIEPPIVIVPSDSCGLQTLSFKKDIEPMITTNCVSSVCHNSGSPPRGIGLDGHFQLSSFIKNDSARFFGSIRFEGFYNYMPIGLPKLDACSILKLETWTRQGLPNN